MKKLTLTFLILLFASPVFAGFGMQIIDGPVVASAPAGSYEIEDSFSSDTSANYTITEQEGTPAVSVSGGKLHQTAAAYKYAFGYHTTSLSSVDHYVQGKIMIGEGLSDYTLLQARHNGTSTCYRVKFVGEGGGNVALYRVVSGTATLIGDIYALGATANTEYNVKLSVSGTGATVTVTVNIDGTDRITSSDTDAARITSGSYVGFGFRQGSDNRDVTIDDFIGDAL